MNQVIQAPGNVNYVLGQHELEGHDRSVRHLVFQWAAQTGDITHVAAMLALDSRTDVIILSEPKLRGEADTAYDTYLNAAASSKRTRPETDDETLKEPNDRLEGRLKLAEKEPGDTNVIYGGLYPSERREIGVALWHTSGDPNRKAPFESDLNLWTYLAKNNRRLEYPTVTVVGATSFIANTFAQIKSEKFYTRMTSALTTERVKQEDIEAWAAAKFNGAFPLPRPKAEAPMTKILLLWSRYSGQNTDTGYNPAGDSDPRGQEQLIALGQSLGFTVVTIGHDTSGGWSPTPNPHAGVHLGEFWRDEQFKDKGRPGQGSLFASIVRNYKVVQIGQKTGGMDSAALLGMPTVYIEDTRSSSLYRMKKWAEVMDRYKGAYIIEPPTQLGKVMRRFPQMPRDEAKELAKKEAAGYLASDLETIQKSLRDMYAKIYGA